MSPLEKLRSKRERIKGTGLMKVREMCVCRIRVVVIRLR